ncbi:hypothetical protein LuPra_01873 [Luteitalea pratensis]|uniref:Gluconate 2-dehydrogenase subunit 3 n=1 Tax=Luteitalea pratensis TaxID=1855912 RepID=A0A143PLL6_LUTPR|nr:gluconate 2-dehydrogenase subunit 3 family protein [Luteitalea pratensis]AMY08669.1 hypothetical protein LuPra_01873 [Luteitalea pratensis]
MTDHGRALPLVWHPDSASAAGASAGTPGGITRRSALQGLAAGLGLAAGTPADAHESHHPLAAHVAQRPTKPAITVAKKPQFFDPHQFATLTLVSELIVPGSVASGSPAWIDEVLAIEHEDLRLTFISALAAVDAAARDQHGSTFRALPATQQPALLESLTTPVATLKSWIAGAHYSSEAGMKELGFTGNVFFESFPACTHAEGHE